jgi:hypothetical protein
LGSLGSLWVLFKGFALFVLQSISLSMDKTNFERKHACISKCKKLLLMLSFSVESSTEFECH